MAARLAEQRDARVLLLEAGGNDASPTIERPGAVADESRFAA
nr:hypothetical protein [Cupriavidus gilardii]